MEIVWEGKGIAEKGLDKNTGKIIVNRFPLFQAHGS
jgi:hypothetical protein